MDWRHKGQWSGALFFSLICAWKKRLNKESRHCRWFETPSRSLWRHNYGPYEVVLSLGNPLDVLQWWHELSSPYFRRHDLYGWSTHSSLLYIHVDEPLASCMIVHFSAHISKWELVCKFGVIFHIFIISCLCSRFQVRNQWFFYSVITFSYTKCFVHSYIVDVVFTLSYLINYSDVITGAMASQITSPTIVYSIVYS